MDPADSVVPIRDERFDFDFNSILFDYIRYRRNQPRLNFERAWLESISTYFTLAWPITLFLLFCSKPSGAVLQGRKGVFSSAVRDSEPFVGEFGLFSLGLYLLFFETWV